MTAEPKPRRANKEGKPWQRSDGRWTARAYGPEANAKAHYVYGKTRAEADQGRRHQDQVPPRSDTHTRAPDAPCPATPAIIA